MASDLKPALAVSAALHLSLLAAGLIVWPNFAKPIPLTPVTVKLVSSAPVADVRPAEEAPKVEQAQAPELAPEPIPVPDPVPAAPTPVPAAPPPKPTPPAPTPPVPTPKPTPAPPKPAPAPLDLNKLAATPLLKTKPAPIDLNKLASSRQLRPAANAQRGPAVRPETAPQARQAVGAAQGLTADEASLLASKLNRLWNPNCGAEGASSITVKVNIQLTPVGALAAQPQLVGPQSNDPVWQAAAQRALNAAARGAPYDELPRDRYAVWKDINVNFDGRQACRGG